MEQKRSKNCKNKDYKSQIINISKYSKPILIPSDGAKEIQNCKNKDYKSQIVNISKHSEPVSGRLP